MMVQAPRRNIRQPGSPSAWMVKPRTSRYQAAEAARSGTARTCVVLSIMGVFRGDRRWGHGGAARVPSARCQRCPRGDGLRRRVRKSAGNATAISAPGGGGAAGPGHHRDGLDRCRGVLPLLPGRPLGREIAIQPRMQGSEVPYLLMDRFLNGCLALMTAHHRLDVPDPEPDELTLILSDLP